MKLLDALTTISVSTLAATLIIEILLRFGLAEVPPTPAELALSSLKYRSAVLARQIFPSSPQTVVLNHRGSMITYRINSRGYRGPDFSEQKSPDSTRIIVYGGSSAFDIGADEGADWPRQVEELLHNDEGSQVEVINAGIPGYALVDCLGALLGEGYEFNPDYIVFYGGWNDIKLLSNSSSLLRSLTPYIKGFNPYIEYFNQADKPLSSLFFSYRFVRAAYVAKAYPTTLEKRGRNGEVAPGVVQERNFVQFEILIRTFFQLAKQIGAKVVIVTEAHLPVASPDRDTVPEINYSLVGLDHDGLVNAYRRIEGILENFAREYDGIYIDASAAMSGQSDYLYDHVHLTKRGSAELAAIVAKGLRTHIAKP